MPEIVYTAEAISTGAGRNGRTRTADGRIDLQLAMPKEMGGNGDGANPEQLFAAGYAACFHSALQLIARTKKVEIGDSSVGARVGIGPDGNGGFGLAVTLEVVIPTLDQAAAKELADAAHAVCPYSNAVRGNIDVDIVVTDD
ncbi:organic hydroperoxide resistance protein [Nocardia carnea]|uniref:organic hydroperoxide resistance protein n=1 Tax=Nocardia carnea TaxID=37328 RepID=UPI002455DFE6|nr:organic hydroperoxide resistance protein [Nocardia carnea]